MNDQAERYTTLIVGLLASYGLNVLGAIVTLIVGFLLAGWLARQTDRLMARSSKIDPVFHPIPGKIVRIGVMIITHVMAQAFAVADRIVVLRHGFVAGNVRTEDSSPDEVVRMITGGIGRVARAGAHQPETGAGT